MLQAEGPVEQRILETARYFVTLHLGRRQTDLVAEAPAPRRVVMEEVAEEVSPLLERLAPAVRERLFGGRAPRVKRPVIVTDGAQGFQTFPERGSVDGYPLVIMRVLRKTSRGG